VMKFAMNAMAEYLKDKKSRMIMTIHDEPVLEGHKDELHYVPHGIKSIMESIYKHQYLPLTVGMNWSDTNLAEKKEGFPQ